MHRLACRDLLRYAAVTARHRKARVAHLAVLDEGEGIRCRVTDEVPPDERPAAGTRPVGRGPGDECAVRPADVAVRRLLLWQCVALEVRAEDATLRLSCGH